jgi:hypothetical protein
MSCSVGIAETFADSDVERKYLQYSPMPALAARSGPLYQVNSDDRGGSASNSKNLAIAYYPAKFMSRWLDNASIPQSDHSRSVPLYSIMPVSSRLLDVSFLAKLSVQWS